MTGLWPIPNHPNLRVIHLANPMVSPAIAMWGNTGGTAAASGTYPTGNKAFYTPFLVFEPCVVKQIFFENSSAVSGNVDVGIYDQEGNRLVSSGSTAHAGTITEQVINITDTYLDRGLYYLGFALDNVTGQIFRFTSTSQLQMRRTYGCWTQINAFPLPDPAVFAVDAAIFLVPYAGLYLDTL